MESGFWTALNLEFEERNVTQGSDGKINIYIVKNVNSDL